MNYSIFDDTMADMNWTEIEKKGKEKVPVLFPLGVIEEHGPHLPLGTDIYFSYAVCKKINESISKLNAESLIAPPYYWGINHCTGGFPGSFSLKPETMKSVLLDIFENLHNFGFDNVYCVNFHGDAKHIFTIIDSIKSATQKYNMNIMMLMEAYEVEQYNLNNEKDYILVNEAHFPEELFEVDDENEKDLLDIHAGAFETAAIKYFYPDAVNTDIASKLKSYSLSQSNLQKWFLGGESTRSVVPLGYAGNPAGYKKQLASIDTIFNILSEYYAKKIIEISK